MRKINMVVIHCSDSSIGDADLIRKWHLDKGFSDIGYHYIILNGCPNHKDAYDPALDGIVQIGRPEEQIGAHAIGVNKNSIGICLIGKKTFTLFQGMALTKLLKDLMIRYNLPILRVIGHYEVRKTGKTCPNIDMCLLRDLLGS